MPQIFELPPGALCALCHRPLQGAVLQDARGQYLCGTHQDAVRVCRFCERAFLPGAGLRAADRCLLCDRRAIQEPAKAAASYQLVLDWMRLRGLELAVPVPPLELRAADVMLKDHSGRALLGYTENRVGLFGHATARRIVLQCGLPPEVFLTVLTHELGHVWLVRARATLPRPIEEGLCDWLAHGLASDLATTDAAVQIRRIEQRDDAIYGQGFRRVRALAAGADVAAMPRLVRALIEDPSRMRMPGDGQLLSVTLEK